MNSLKQKETHRQREQAWGCQGNSGWKRDGLGVWDQQIQTIIYRMDKGQVLLYSIGNYIQYPVTNHNEKEYEKYAYMTESFCSRAESNTLYYTSKK